MIKNLEIFNFRCFEEISILGFNKVNLIGGKNNSGKTALLETLYLGNSPSGRTVRALLRLRNESLNFIRKLPDRAWNNFYFNQNKGELARIILINEKGTTELQFLCNNSVKKFSEVIKDKLDDGVDVRSILRLVDKEKGLLSSLIAHRHGIVIKETSLVEKANFIPTSLKLTDSNLAEEYDKAELNGRADYVLRAIRNLDESIIQIKSFSIGEPNLYLKRENQEFLPISLFGEAINKVTQFILTLVNNPHNILLIDELENGIHYTNQRNLWRMLFKLAVEFEVQIFATTHSLEMIQAFRDVWSEEGHQDMGAYIELARHIETGRIIGINHPLELLNYELQHGGKEIRGE